MPARLLEWSKELMRSNNIKVRIHPFCDITKVVISQKGWSQEYAARRLGVSQPYLSMLERDERRVPEQLARKAAGLYRLLAAVLPTTLMWDSVPPADEDTLALDLAALGYPGLSYLKPKRKRNPAEILLSALSASDLDSRLTEALPWVLLKFPELDWRWLVVAAQL